MLCRHAGRGQQCRQPGAGVGADAAGVTGVAGEPHERLAQVVLVGSQPVGEAHLVLDGHHEGSAGSHEGGQVRKEGAGVGAGVFEHPDAGHQVEPVGVGRGRNRGGVADAHVDVEALTAHACHLGP